MENRKKRGLNGIALSKLCDLISAVPLYGLDLLSVCSCVDVFSIEKGSLGRTFKLIGFFVQMDFFAVCFYKSEEETNFNSRYHCIEQIFENACKCRMSHQCFWSVLPEYQKRLNINPYCKNTLAYKE